MHQLKAAATTMCESVPQYDKIYFLSLGEEDSGPVDEALASGDEETPKNVNVSSLSS